MTTLIWNGTRFSVDKHALHAGEYLDVQLADGTWVDGRYEYQRVEPDDVDPFDCGLCPMFWYPVRLKVLRTDGFNVRYVEATEQRAIVIHPGMQVRRGVAP